MSVTVDTYAQIWDARPVSLSQQQESDTIRRAQSGDGDAVLSLLVAYRPVMLSIVRDYDSRIRLVWRWGSASSDDYRSAAVEGVMMAIQAWREDAGPRLAGIVRQYVTEAVGSAGCGTAVLSVPERTLKRFYSIAKESEYDLDAGMELAPKYEMLPATFAHIWECVRAESLDTTPNNDNGGLLGISPCDDAPRTEVEVVQPLWHTNTDAYTDAEDSILVDLAFAAVDDDEARVCELRFGFTVPRPLTLGETAERIGWTTSKTNRTQQRAINKMRTAIGVTHLD